MLSVTFNFFRLNVSVRYIFSSFSVFGSTIMIYRRLNRERRMSKCKFSLHMYIMCVRTKMMIFMTPKKICTISRFTEKLLLFFLSKLKMEFFLSLFFSFFHQSHGKKSQKYIRMCVCLNRCGNLEGNVVSVLMQTKLKNAIKIRGLFRVLCRTFVCTFLVRSWK